MPNLSLERVRALRSATAKEIADLEAQLRVLRVRLSTLDDVLRNGVDEAPTLPLADVSRASPQAPKGNNKEIVCWLLERNAPNGLTIHEILARAAEAGAQLKRGTISSLLSHLKADGVLAHANNRYFLAARPRHNGHSNEKTAMRNALN